MANILVPIVNIMGPQGVSVESVDVDEAHHLIVYLSDGTTHDAGYVRGTQGLAGPGAVPADSAVAGFVSTEGTSETQTALDARYAPLPGLTRNPLTGWFHADGHGAIDNGVFNCTTILQGMINAIIARGGGTLFLPKVGDGVYFFDQLTIVGYKQNVNLTIQAEPGVVLQANSALTTDAIILDSQALPGEQYMRRVKFVDLNIQGQSFWDNHVRINRRGVFIGRAQDITFVRTRIRQFRKGALVLDDAWDNFFDNLEITWSGIGESDADYAYALLFTGTNDNSNANKFVGLHMEFCPLNIKFEKNSRHNYFTATKIEEGGGVVQNLSTRSPIWQQQGIENTFVGGFYAKSGSTSNVAVVKGDLNTDAYLSTYKIIPKLTFIGFSFFANSANSARWADGYDLDFNDCNFSRTNGGAGGYGFSLNDGSRVVNSYISYVDAGVNTFALRGRCEIRGNEYQITGAGNVGSIYTIFPTALNYAIGPNRTVGTVSNRATLTSGTQLGEVRVADQGNPIQEYAGGGTKNVFGLEMVRLIDSSAATYTNFVAAANGQRLVIVPTTAFVTIAHGTTTIRLKGAVNKTLAAYETMQLVMVDGVWQQI